MKKLIVILTLTLLAGMAFANGGSDADDGMIHIGLSMDSLESAFWVANYDAMVAEAEKQGVKMTSIMAEGDAVKQNQQIENLIASGVDVIICAPKDGAAIATSVKKAQDAGVPMIMNNRPVQGDIVPALTVLSDNETMAYDVLTWFAKKAVSEGKSYKTILLIGNLADENAAERQKGHERVIAEYPQVFDVVSRIPTEWNHEVALKGLQNALQATPDVNLVITPSDFLYPPIKSSLESAGKWAKIGEPNHVAIVSFDGDGVGMQMLKDGYSEADAAQDATGTGVVCVEWAIKLANGESPSEVVFRDAGIVVTVDNWDEKAHLVWGYADVK